MGLVGGTTRRVFFLFAAFTFVMLAGARTAFAQGVERQIEAIDWAYHVPLAIGCVLLVVAVDAIVIYMFVRRG